MTIFTERTNSWHNYFIFQYFLNELENEIVMPRVCSLCKYGHLFCAFYRSVHIVEWIINLPLQFYTALFHNTKGGNKKKLGHLFHIDLKYSVFYKQKYFFVICLRPICL